LYDLLLHKIIEKPIDKGTNSYKIKVAKHTELSIKYCEANTKQ